MTFSLAILNGSLLLDALRDGGALGLWLLCSVILAIVARRNHRASKSTLDRVRAWSAALLWLVGAIWLLSGRVVFEVTARALPTTMLFEAILVSYVVVCVLALVLVVAYSVGVWRLCRLLAARDRLVFSAASTAALACPMVAMLVCSDLRLAQSSRPFAGGSSDLPPARIALLQPGSAVVQLVAIGASDARGTETISISSGQLGAPLIFASADSEGALLLVADTKASPAAFTEIQRFAGCEGAPEVPNTSPSNWRRWARASSLSLHDREDGATSVSVSPLGSLGIEARWEDGVRVFSLAVPWQNLPFAQAVRIDERYLVAVLHGRACLIDLQDRAISVLDRAVWVVVFREVGSPAFRRN